MKLNKGNKFWAELEVQTDGTLKVKKAKQYRHVNQYKRTWRAVNSRELARAVSKTVLVTR